MMRRAVCGLALSLAALPARASVVAALGLDALAQRSALIVHAGVYGVDDELSTMPEGPFRTRVELEVLDVIKGGARAGELLTLELPGGRAGKRVMTVEGMPRFVAGQEVVLLLEATPRGYALAGMWLGFFVVHRDTGRAWAERAAGGSTRPLGDRRALWPNASVELSALLATLGSVVEVRP